MKSFLTILLCLMTSLNVMAISDSDTSLSLQINTPFTLLKDVTFKGDGSDIGANQSEWNHNCRILKDPSAICRTVCTLSSENRSISNTPKFPDLTLPKGAILKLDSITTFKSLFGIDSALSFKGSDFERFKMHCTTIEVSRTETRIKLDPTIFEIRQTLKDIFSF